MYISVIVVKKGGAQRRISHSHSSDPTGARESRVYLPDWVTSGGARQFGLGGLAIEAVQELVKRGNFFPPLVR